MAQAEEPGSRTTASGYTTKASPAPSLATRSTGRPVSNDMKPITEKMTKPPSTLVKQFTKDTKTASLAMLLLNLVKQFITSTLFLLSAQIPTKERKTTN